jgi:hypothetical protein
MIKASDKVYYKKGYKYVLDKDLVVYTRIRPDADISTDFICLNRNGMLVIKKYYASDGPSGPSIDTRSFMRGAFVHDALYQLIREGHLPPEAKHLADLELKEICKEDGMMSLRACYVYKAVDLFGKDSMIHDRKILSAP